IRIARNGCAAGIRSSISTYEKSSPFRSSEPRIKPSVLLTARNHIRNDLSGGAFFSSLLAWMTTSPVTVPVVAALATRHNDTGLGAARLVTTTAGAPETAACGLHCGWREGDGSGRSAS